MYKSSDFTKEVYKTGEILKLLNISYETLKTYDKQGKLPVKRTSTGRRLFFREDIINYLDSLGMIYRNENDSKHDIVYARVQSNENGELDKQVLYLMENISDLRNPIVLKEIGNESDDKREKLIELMNLVGSNNVRRVFVTNENILANCGLNYLKEFFKINNVNLVIIGIMEK